MSDCKKKGRNAKWCKSYRDAQRREINKARRFIRTIKAQPNNDAARSALKAFVQKARKAGVYFGKLDRVVDEYMALQS